MQTADPRQGSIRVVSPLGGEATGGRWAVLEVELEAGAEVPPHALGREDLVLYVVAGEVELHGGPETEPLAGGAVRMLARGRARALHARTDAVLLCLLVPAGNEGLAVELARGEVDRDDGAALLAAAGVELLPRLPALGLARPR